MDGNKRLWQLLLVLSCLVFLVIAASIASIRPPNWDDGWFASPPYNLLHHGHFGTSTLDPHGYLLRPELLRIEQRTYWVLPFHLIAQVPWFAVFGVGIMQMRLFSILWSVALLFALWVFVKRISDDYSSATIATLLLCTDSLLVFRGGDGRMDAFCLSLGWLGLASYVVLRERSLAGAILLSNTLICLSGLTHPNGVLHLAILVTVAFLLDANNLRWRQLLLAFTPYLVGGLCFAAFVAQDLEAFRAQIMGNHAGERMSYLINPLRGIIEELDRHLTYYGIRGASGPASMIKALIPAALYGGWLGLAFSTRLRTPASRIFFVTGLIAIAFLTFFNAKNYYYLIFLLPPLCAAAGVWLASLLRGAMMTRIFAVTVICAVLAVNLLTSWKRLETWRSYNTEYQDVVRLVQPRMTPGQRVLGPPHFAFYLGFDNVFQDDTLGYFSGKRPQVLIDYKLAPDEIERMSQLAPEILAHRQKVLGQEYRKLFQGPVFSVFERR